METIACFELTFLMLIFEIHFKNNLSLNIHITNILWTRQVAYILYI